MGAACNSVPRSGKHHTCSHHSCICFILRTGQRVVIVRVGRDGHQLPTAKANEGLVDTDRVEVAPVIAEHCDRLRVACAASIVKATELGSAEGWIEGPLAEGVFRERPSRHAANGHA
jgi:hypothetical protein